MGRFRSNLKDRQARLQFLRDNLPEREYAIFGLDGIIAWCAAMGIRDARGRVPSKETLRRWREDGRIAWMVGSRGSRFHRTWTTNYAMLACLLGLVNKKRGTPKVPLRAKDEPAVTRWEGLL